MSEHEALRSAVETLASDPRVAAGVSVGTAAIGITQSITVVNGVLGTVAIILGIVSAIMVVRVHWLNSKILEKQLEKWK